MVKKYLKIFFIAFFALAIGILAYKVGVHEFSGNGAEVVKANSAAIATKSSQENHISWNLWAIISIVLLVINFLVTIVTLKILKWRKSVSNGMIALVPSELTAQLNIVASSQSKLIQWLQGNFSEISKLLKDNSESINILKNELSNKETELARLRDGNLKNEKIKLINKVVKLHIFFNTLSKQIKNNEVDPLSAVNVLDEELSEIFSEFDIHLINPGVHTSVKNLFNDSFVLKDINKTDQENLDSTIHQVVDIGYYTSSPDGIVRIIKPANLVINKFGD
jgi:hypothetical protein